MQHALRTTFVFAVLAASPLLANAQQPVQSGQAKAAQKTEQSHDGHPDGVNQRGDQAMGFSHAKTTHHFLLKTDGGVIQVEANAADDTASRDQIRQHLRHIAKKFTVGDFAAPMFIHAQTPPGVPAMQQLKAKIKYEFEERERGGQVRISTNNAAALKAIHEFLRFQIKDHQTGDALEVTER